MPAVVKIGPETRAHHEAMVFVHGDIAEVKEAVDVRPEEQAIGPLVLTSGCEGFAAGSIQNWQGWVQPVGATWLIS
ncbi:hypothetical protein MON41_07340 [Roseomonas vastitatis]|uniref:Uncharacterized protein n=1 Tax=Teichococcus vastitatis TaxID=2307076 RepID=A0ABS9W2P4_9PROT|nr:hypothetical protein [Pseudoroseomonas vastitatis]MCI0753571.1 hypothetical protein [Pseudoroseomonas vastitatis]